MNLRATMRAYDRESDRIAEREEQHFERHGRYSPCAGCGEECNPSNVHADGRKFCDACWEEDDDEYGSLTDSERKIIAFRERMDQQLGAVPVKKHSTRLQFMRFAEKLSHTHPIAGSPEATYQLFMRWAAGRNGVPLPQRIAEATERRSFVLANRPALTVIIARGLRPGGDAPGRLKERCSVEDVLARMADLHPNSNTDYTALSYLERLRASLGVGLTK